MFIKISNLIHQGNNQSLRDFPGVSVLKTLPSNVGGVSSIPGWGTKISHASGPKKIKKHKTDAVL